MRPLFCTAQQYWGVHAVTPRGAAFRIPPTLYFCPRSRQWSHRAAGYPLAMPAPPKLPIPFAGEFRMKLLHRVTPVAMAFGALLLAGAAQAADTIKIGIPQPMTGPNTQYGTQIQAGALTAIETINAQGGVKGKKLEPILIDDGCEPKQAVPAANRVVNSGAKFAVAHACSGVTVPAVNVYEQEGIVAITPGATSPLVTDTTKPHFFFRTIGRDDQQGPFAARYIANTLKPQKVAVLHDKQTYGSGVATQVKESLEKNKVNVVMFEGINVGDSDYSAVITKLKSAGVDRVYLDRKSDV